MTFSLTGDNTYFGICVTLRTYSSAENLHIYFVSCILQHHKSEVVGSFPSILIHHYDTSYNVYNVYNVQLCYTFSCKKISVSCILCYAVGSNNISYVLTFVLESLINHFVHVTFL